MLKRVIGIDIGGTNLKAGLLTRQGNLLVESHLPLEEKDKSEEGMVDIAHRAIETLLTQSGQTLESIQGVGIGIAGVIDTVDGIITQSPQFPAWRNFAFSARLSSRIGRPVAMENDVNAIARGEQWCGALRGEDNYIVMAIGTGFGGAICLDGKLWRGIQGMGGEIGHICVEPDGFPCNCGSRGCLESIASATALVRSVKRDGFAEVLSLAGQESEIPHRLAQMAEQGNERAKAYWDRFGYGIGLALAGLLNVLNVKLVMFGGGLSKSFHLFRPALEREMKARAFPAITENVEFRTCELWENAGIFGAAANLIHEMTRKGLSD